MDIVDDHGGGSLAYVCDHALRDGNKVYLSGSGADEIFSDYGFGGVKKNINIVTLVDCFLMI